LVALWQVVVKVDLLATFFTIIDGLKGFHQIPLHPDSHHLTTFIVSLAAIATVT
jgi:hypothetical protein